jgi:hypothetical protein
MLSCAAAERTALHFVRDSDRNVVGPAGRRRFSTVMIEMQKDLRIHERPLPWFEAKKLSAFGTIDVHR